MPVNVVVGAAGTATFTWPGVPADEIWTGAASVPLAVPASVLPILWSATDGGNPIGQWYNSQSSGPLQVTTQLKITGSGIAAVASLVAAFQGIATDIASAPPWWPAPTPAPPPSGFTTIVSGLNNPTAITVNPQYLTATGGLSLTPVWFPVTVGTALEIAWFSASAVSQRLTPLWASSASSGSIVHNSDTFDVSFVSPNNIMQGMTYINHGPFVAFLIQGVGGTPGIVINTGLPAVARPPSVVAGILASGSQSFASGSTTIGLAPYVGDVILSAELGSGPIANFDVQVTMADYLGNSFQSALVQATQLVAGVVSNIVPTRFAIPPAICSVVINNRNAGAVNGNFQVVAVGP
jgi:hypothetical protein